ncbi:hypothetical protein C8J57DRAFT_1480202 [Mycena rebaudengoi]|nr:hypothetical protein C8J57DRAFT_1480202 [Mycena rebaudengoi]
MLDPMTRLPVEISSEIFILCLPDSAYRRPNPAAAPLLLLRICTAWADIARSTPTLWDTIRVDFPRPEGFENLFHSYLARAQTRGLALTLSGRYDEARFASLWPESALPAASANLKALTLYPSYILDPAGILRLLRAAPAGLVECTLLDGYYLGSRTDSLTLPCLQSLSLKAPYGCHLDILKYLSAPALRRLTILRIHDDVDEALLISFLTRLEAPLQSLHLKISHPVAYAQFLNLVPTLTCLRLSWDTSTLFLNFLGGSPQQFLPQVHDLTFSVRDLHQPDSEFHPLCNLLSARGSQITTFRFIHEDYTFITPPLDVLHTLRQLAEEFGMKIHFGTTDINFI